MIRSIHFFDESVHPAIENGDASSFLGGV